MYVVSFFSTQIRFTIVAGAQYLDSRRSVAVGASQPRIDELNNLFRATKPLGCLTKVQSPANPERNPDESLKTARQKAWEPKETTEPDEPSSIITRRPGSRSILHD